MELGITPWEFDRGAAALSDQAARAEQLGYHGFWLPENHFNPNALPDPLMLLAAVAAATHRIRLATTSYLLPLRRALQAAEQVAVLDQLSNGRVILGVGRGYAPLVLRAFDVLPRDKRALFEASLGTMIHAWSGAPVALDGRGEDRVVLDPLPVQRPHPPIWVAAFGPKALAQAGRLGLPYLASPVETLDGLAANYALHAAAATAAGREVPSTVPVMRTLFVAGSAREAASIREQLHRAAASTGRLAAPASPDDWCIVGESGYVRERVQAYRERLGVTHLIATRLRIEGVPRARLERSAAATAELLG